MRPGGSPTKTGPHPGPLSGGEGERPVLPRPSPRGRGGGRPHPGPLPGGEGEGRGKAPSPRPSPRGRGGGTREGALTPALSQGERGRDRPTSPLPLGEVEGDGRGEGPDLSWGLSQGRGRTETLAPDSGCVGLPLA